jgi:hypothetical protein
LLQAKRKKYDEEQTQWLQHSFSGYEDSAGHDQQFFDLHRGLPEPVLGGKALGLGSKSGARA